MGKSNEDIEIHNEFIIRKPKLSLNVLFDFLEDEDINNINLPELKKAILLSSESTYNQLFKSELFSKEKSNTVIKYFLRSCSRPTPFGQFSSLGSLKFGNKDHFKICRTDLLIEVKNNGPVDNTYFTNPSLLVKQNRGSIIYFSDENKDLNFSSFKVNTILKKLLSFIKYPTKEENIISFIVEKGFSKKDSINFLNVLVLKGIIIKSAKINEINSIKPNEIRKNVNSSGYVNSQSIDKYELSSLDLKHKNKIIKGIEYLEALNSNNENIYLQNFKKEFIKFYGKRSIPILDVFNPIHGLYTSKIKPNSFNSKYLDLFKNNSSESTNSVEVDSLEYKRKVINTLVNYERDDTIGSKLCTSFSGIVEIYFDKKPKYFMDFYGGVTSRVLLNRFVKYDKDFSRIFKDLKSDNLTQKNYTHPEVIYKPKSKTFLFDCYDENSIKLSINDIVENDSLFLKDVTIGIKNDKLFLWHKKLKKKIKPIIENSLNPKFIEYELVKFLYFFQFQNNTEGISFNWPEKYKNCIQKPRIEFDDIILSKQKWTLTKKNFNESNIKGLFNEFKLLKEEYGIPKVVLFVENNNGIPINTESILMFEFIVKILNKNGEIEFEEFIFNDQNGLSIDDEKYANEFLFFFNKTK